MPINEVHGRNAAEQHAAFKRWHTLEAQGIRIVDVAPDFSRVVVSLARTPENAN